ncbi:AAA family ATPase [Vibrio cholerae]|uniref:ATP-binding protein n=2 Tax=Vibrio cholerae TaxID=666 RepID=UPI000892AA72|nr:ATP-binding protein [Vibrio cholerae]EGQ9890886.1 AAA family ATPase [Vibrio cholerae]EGQ9983463.1 AAA family ATPase [Vibrio cholerae]EHD7114136.1 AAA family ATPase [Vibrio cholerae]EHU8075683.1 AAA family ATPase [Vibrio cholerae]EHV1351694.1 AAA family ATPase [Vibrio cholerae]
MKKIHFVAGVHGAGKGTLCSKLKESLNIPIYSCSDLIKENSDYVEETKEVTTAERNQRALLIGLAEIQDSEFLLDGHFCLVGKNQEIIQLSYDVFDEINPCSIILVSANVTEIYERLNARDGYALNKNVLYRLQSQEKQRVSEYSELKCINFHIYESGTETYTVELFIKSR